jgi:hypothetical protein
VIAVPSKLAPTSALGVALRVMLGFCVACGRRDLGAAPAPPGSPAAAARVDAPKSPESPAPRPRPISRDAVRSVTLAWSTALDRHDVSALVGLYGEHVRFYGRDTTRQAVIDAKRAALGPSSTYRQSIVSLVDVAPAEGDTMIATFTKRSGSASRMREVSARLVLSASDGGAPVIVEETDDPTQNRASQPAREKCEEVAGRVVGELPSVKRALGAARAEANESDGEANFGGTSPTDTDDGFTVEMGLHSNSSFDARVSYTVDHAGHLSVNVLGKDLAVPNDALRTVEQACRTDPR